MAKKGGNPQNLKKNLTPDEARTQGQKGGIASGKARREKKTLQEELLALLSAVEDGETETINNRIAASIIKKALAGDVKAFEVIRDTVGEKPKDELNVNAVFNSGGLTKTLEALNRED